MYTQAHARTHYKQEMAEASAPDKKASGDVGATVGTDDMPELVDAGDTGDTEKVETKVVLPNDENGYKAVASLMLGKQGICGSSEGIQIKTAKCGVKRCEYVTGKRLLDFVAQNTEKLKKVGVEVSSKHVNLFVEGLIRSGVLIKALQDKERGKGILQPVKGSKCTMAELKAAKCFFIWDYDGSEQQSLKTMLSGAIVFIAIGLCLFPVWPRFMKVALWYVSVTFLIFLTLFIIFRLLVWLVCWILGFDVWILPNVFDDDLPVSASFTPLLSYEKSPDGELYARIVTLVVLGICGYFVATAPTTFDTYIAESKSFTADLYEGKFLSDSSQTDKDNIDKPKFDTLEDILGFTDDVPDEVQEALKEKKDEDDLLSQILQEEEDESIAYEDEKRREIMEAGERKAEESGKKKEAKAKAEANDAGEEKANL